MLIPPPDSPADLRQPVCDATLNVVHIEQNCLSSIFTITSWIVRFFIELEKQIVRLAYRMICVDDLELGELSLISEINLFGSCFR